LRDAVTGPVKMHCPKKHIQTKNINALDANNFCPNTIFKLTTIKLFQPLELSFYKKQVNYPTFLYNRKTYFFTAKRDTIVYIVIILPITITNYTVFDGIFAEEVAIIKSKTGGLTTKLPRFFLIVVLFVKFY